MTVLVTGATGFLGRHLVPQLLAEHRHVRCAVRNPATASEWLPSAVQLTKVPQVDGATDWHAALEGVSCVFHLAARAHILEERAKNPLDAFLRVNTEGTRTLAQAAVAAGVKRMVFVSSIKVNGERTNAHPYRADDVPAPVDDYGVSKQRAEAALREVAATGGLEAVIVRPPLVYGPGVGANFLKLLKLIDRGIPLPLGSVRNRRSLVSVWNLCDLLATCGRSAAAPGRTFMVSDGRDLSTPELIRSIAQALDRPARLPRVPLAWLQFAAKASGQMAQYARLCYSLVVDMNPTQKTLDWRPPMTVEESLARTVSWYRTLRA
jgi:nucleoside-diphosphate-sugar epimerase